MRNRRYVTVIVENMAIEKHFEMAWAFPVHDEAEI